MGRTPKPLKLLVSPSLAETTEIKALADKGHEVVSFAIDADIILHERAWRMVPELLPYLDLAVKAAWDIKYPLKGKK